MIREANHATPTNPFDVKTVVSSHCAFASQPRALADLLEGLG